MEPSEEFEVYSQCLTAESVRKRYENFLKEWKPDSDIRPCMQICYLRSLSQAREDSYAAVRKYLRTVHVSKAVLCYRASIIYDNHIYCCSGIWESPDSYANECLQARNIVWLKYHEEHEHLKIGEAHYWVDKKSSAFWVNDFQIAELNYSSDPAALHDDWRCAYCSEWFPEGFNRTVDHIIPQVAGGPDILWNTVQACRSCNSHKNDRFMLPANLTPIFWRNASLWAKTTKQMFWKTILAAQMPDYLKGEK